MKLYKYKNTVIYGNTMSDVINGVCVYSDNRFLIGSYDNWSSKVYEEIEMVTIKSSDISKTKLYKHGINLLIVNEEFEKACYVSHSAVVGIKKSSLLEKGIKGVGVPPLNKFTELGQLTIKSR